ncbi:KRH1-like protein, partial [Mya arenaria]
MRLRREDPGGSSPEDSTEYKTAVKSVIWCEIKSLLQKLAAVTGEESIVISTNLTEGTYSHLGSFLGQEYLDDREDHILSLCTSFSQFCSGLQNHAVVLQEPETVFKENEREGPSPGPQMNPRKRPLTPDTGTHTHHHKRKSTHPHSLHGKSDQTAHFDKCFMNQSRSADIDSVNQSENPVLSGFYDSDNYPRYKQRKNPVKKSKTKDKATSLLGLEESPSTPTNSTKDNLHMRTFESGGRLVYACDVCKRELSHLTSYRRHMKLHTMERPHKCPVCLKGFIRKYHCIDHLNKHHKGVEFCPESLLLTGASRELYGGPVNTDQSALSDSHSISPGEFNYTLDQSLEASSDPDQSVNADISIDQSASSILSELARSAAKENIQVKEASNLPE